MEPGHEKVQDGVTAARTSTPCSTWLASTVPTCWSGTPSAAHYALTSPACTPSRWPAWCSSTARARAVHRDPSYAGQYAVVHRVKALTPALHRFGLGRVVAAVASSHLPTAAADQVTALTATARGARSASAEWQLLPTLFPQAQELTTFATVPWRS